MWFEIQKVDEEQRLVEGWAITDEPDLQGDVIPFDVAVAAFEQYAPRLGIREMHQPKAVGRLRKWWPDHEHKRIGIQVYLSKSQDGEDALQKVKEGILRGFSIGGRALSKVTMTVKGMLVNMINALQLTEISLVDVPANPSCVITLVKVEENEDVNKVKIPKKEGEPKSPPAGYPEDPDKYADPANYSWPVDTAARVRAAISYYNGGRGKDKYTQAEWDTIGRRIAAAASKKLEADYELRDGKVQQKEVKKMDANEILQNLRATLEAATAQPGTDAEAILSQLRSVLQVATDTITPETSKVPASTATTEKGVTVEVSSDSSTSTPSTPSTPSTLSTPSLTESTPSTATATPLTASAVATPSVTAPAPPAPAQADVLAQLARMLEELPAKIAACMKEAAGPQTQAQTQTRTQGTPSTATTPTPSVTKAEAVQPAAPTGSGLPAADVPKKGVDQYGMIRKALLEGRKEEAIKLAGGEAKLQDLVFKLATAETMAAGVTTNRFIVYDPGAPVVPQAR
jgi:hypothetical protein